MSWHFISRKMTISKIFTLLLLAGHCSAITKRWLPNTNYDNPKNWNVSRLPCPMDNVVFGRQDETVSVYLQSNSTLREMILPTDGVIVLANDMILTFTDESSDPSCKGEDVEFIGGSAKDWFNPRHWEAPYETVIPETEIVPCVYDEVVFPEGNEFHVKIDADVSVSAMKIDGTDYTTESLVSFLQSADGHDQFTTGAQSADIPSVSVKKRVCTDATGCQCGNDGPEMKERICQSFSCYPYLCKDPVMPVGGCCFHCGAFVDMLYNKDTFTMKRFKKMILEKFANKDRYQGAKTSISKTIEDRIQVVCADYLESGKAVALATEIYNYLLRNTQYYGVSNVTITTSGSGTGRLRAGDINGGTVAGIIISVLIVLALCTVGALLYRKGWCDRRGKPLSLEMELGISEYSNSAIEPAGSLSAFDNPMYDITPISQTPDSETKYNPMYSPDMFNEEDDGTLRGFSNPVEIESTFNIPLDDDDDSGISDKKQIIESGESQA
ncbi:protein amnionless-like [Ptychodera flava]|uniref:protein amnionless-like n=1 Tax=Ptychodera flava TaxID=63121 RepID=UPI00396AA046